ARLPWHARRGARRSRRVPLHPAHRRARHRRAARFRGEAARAHGALLRRLPDPAWWCGDGRGARGTRPAGGSDVRMSERETTHASSVEDAARAASSLMHPNVVTIFDVGDHDGAPYLVMELVEGESLRACFSKTLPLERVLELGIQIAEGLAAAHERGVVHRDLKPENVVVTESGVAKVLDFGLALFRTPRPAGAGTGDSDAATLRLTGEGTILGTLGFMAPETFTGSEVDRRADQFSLGAILYEM